MPRRQKDTQGWSEPQTDVTPVITAVIDTPLPVVATGEIVDEETDAEYDPDVHAVDMALRVQAPPSLQLFEHFEVTKTSLRMRGNATWEEWASMGSMLRFFEISLSWAMGDWMNSGEGKWGDKCAQVIDATDFSIETVRNYAWVAAKVPPENRIVGLSFAHHQAVANIDSVTEQKRWLDRAVKYTLTVKDLKKAIKDKQEGAPTSEPTERYLVIVECDHEEDQQACCRQLENLDRKYTTKVERKG